MLSSCYIIFEKIDLFEYLINCFIYGFPYKHDFNSTTGNLLISVILHFCVLLLFSFKKEDRTIINIVKL